MSTLREVRLDISNRLKQLQSGVLLDTIGRDLLVATGQRIWDRNEKSAGGKIVTSYSTKPLYAPVKASSKLKPLGKQGKSTFKNGKKKKSQYIPQGYKGLKRAVGRPLPLELTGQLRASYNSERQDEAVVLGFQDTQRKTFASGVREPADISNDGLRIALEDKYGVFTALSKEEEELIDKVVENFINNINQ